MQCCQCDDDEINASITTDTYNTKLLLAGVAAATSRSTSHEVLSGSVKDFFRTVTPSYSMDIFRSHFRMTTHTFEVYKSLSYLRYSVHRVHFY